jgi:xylulose-5-phosphate/fructose-6-phosphate phosphoketolase
MGANPHANGGMLLRDLRMPDFRDHAVQVPAPGAVTALSRGIEKVDGRLEETMPAVRHSPAGLANQIL